MRLWIGMLIAGAMPVPAAAEMHAVGTPIGKWVVMGDSDPMTDKKSCTAFYGDTKQIQMTSDSFAISYNGRGGLNGYTIRFDEDSPLEMALPTRVEKEVDAFIIDNKDRRFDRILRAHRMRVQTLTVLGSLVNDDIDLSMIGPLMARLTGPDCNEAP